MPRALVLAPAAGERGRERPVTGAPLRRGRAMEDRRTNERMPEPKRAVADTNEPGILCPLKPGRVDAEPLERSHDRLELLRRTDRRHQQRVTRGPGQRPHTAREGSLDRRAGGQRVAERLTPHQLRRSQQSWQLEQS
jgi:hypothetical protein